MSSRRGRRATGQPEIEWNFVSFPSFVAFVAGVFVSTLLIAFDIGGFLGGLHTVLWYAALIGVSFSLAHIFTRVLARRRQERRRQREEEEERERRVLAARARAAASPEGQSEEGPRRRRRRRRG